MLRYFALRTAGFLSLTTLSVLVLALPYIVEGL